MRRVIKVAERHADGAATTDELRTAHGHEITDNRSRFDKQGLLWGHGPDGPHGRVIASWAYQATEGACVAPKPSPERSVSRWKCAPQAAGEPNVADQAVQAAILHDIIGNPFRPVTPDLSWLSSTAQQLAESIYQERAFARSGAG